MENVVTYPDIVSEKFIGLNLSEDVQVFFNLVDENKVLNLY